MQLQQLKQFLVVAELEHMTKAAEALQISQPSLSQNIARLEEELGVSLFDRQGRQIRLNDFGQQFLDHVLNATRELDDGVRVINDLSGPDKGMIRVADLGSATLVTQIMRHFTHRYPDVYIRHLFQTREEMKKSLIAGTVDIGMTTNPPDEPEFEWIPLGEAWMELMLPRDHPVEEDSMVPLDYFRDELFLGPAEIVETRQIFNHLCHMSGFRPKIIVESNDSYMLFESVGEGRGINFYINGAHPNFRVKSKQGPVKQCFLSEPKASHTIGMVVIKNHYMSQAAKAFMEFAQKMFTADLRDI